MQTMTEIIERDWARARDGRCDECGFEPAAYRDRALPAAIRAMGERWVVFVDASLSRRDGDALMRSRPRPDTWTPLELACHVRDALDLAASRVEVTLRGELPQYATWDYQNLVEALGYGDDSPHDVAADIGVNAGRLADALSGADRKTWERSGTMRGQRFTASGLTRFALHEGHHHLIEAERATQVVGAG